MTIHRNLTKSLKQIVASDIQKKVTTVSKVASVRYLTEYGFIQKQIAAYRIKICI